MFLRLLYSPFILKCPLFIRVFKGIVKNSIYSFPLAQVASAGLVNKLFLCLFLPIWCNKCTIYDSQLGINSRFRGKYALLEVKLKNPLFMRVFEQFTNFRGVKLGGKPEINVIFEIKVRLFYLPPEH